MCLELGGRGPPLHPHVEAVGSGRRGGGKEAQHLPLHAHCTHTTHGPCAGPQRKLPSRLPAGSRCEQKAKTRKRCPLLADTFHELQK